MVNWIKLVGNRIYQSDPKIIEAMIKKGDFNPNVFRKDNCHDFDANDKFIRFAKK